MPEIRRNPITGELVILAPERAARPHDFAAAGRPPPRPARQHQRRASIPAQAIGLGIQTTKYSKP